MEKQSGNRRGRRSRAEILDAAAQVMSERGYVGTSMSTLATTTGLPKSAIYHHFGSKEGLLSEVMARGARDFFSRMRSTRLDVPEGTPHQRLEILLLRTLEAFEASGPFIRLFVLLLLTESVDSQEVADILTQVRDEGREQMRQLVMVSFAAEGPEIASAVAADLDYFGVSGFDGAFIGVHAEDEHPFPERIAMLAEAMAALGAARVAAYKAAKS